MAEKNLTFNITYYPDFQNVRSIIQELHILSTPNKEHKRLFPNAPVIGIWNGKTLKDYLVKRRLPIFNKEWYMWIMWEKKLVWSVTLKVLLRRLQQKPAMKLFKIQSDLLNCDSEKIEK